jgi:hypothetical protein
MQIGTQISILRAGTVAALILLTSSCVVSQVPQEGVTPSLRPERDRAVRAGLIWLDRYLADDENVAALGVDAVAIFADYAATSADEVSRRFSLSAARRHACNLAEHFLHREFIETDEVPDLILLLTQMRELGLDVAAVREAVAREIRALPDPDHVYGLASLDPADLDLLEENRVFVLLLEVYAVERAAAVGEDFGIRFGLKELLPVILRRRLIERAEDPDPTGEPFRDHVYRATHVAYVLNDYGRLRQREEDAPGVFLYLRRVFPDVLAARDVELVAEIVDVFRSLGHDETSSDLMRQSIVFLLGAQNEDGSWGPGSEHEDSYLGAHHTWCAIMALGERRCLTDTPYERRLREMFRRRRSSAALPGHDGM